MRLNIYLKGTGGTLGSTQRTSSGIEHKEKKRDTEPLWHESFHPFTVPNGRNKTYRVHSENNRLRFTKLLTTKDMGHDEKYKQKTKNR